MTDRKTPVTITRLRYRGYAECEQGDLRPDALRGRCRLHVQQTGHTVRFVIEDTTVYKPGQEEAS